MSDDDDEAKSKKALKKAEKQAAKEAKERKAQRGVLDDLDSDDGEKEPKPSLHRRRLRRCTVSASPRLAWLPTTAQREPSPGVPSPRLTPHLHAAPGTRPPSRS